MDISHGIGPKAYLSRPKVQLCGLRHSGKVYATQMEHDRSVWPQETQAAASVPDQEALKTPKMSHAI
jgi:hypothetical protein